MSEPVHLCDEFCRHTVPGAHPALVDKRARTLDDGTDAGGYLVPPAVLAAHDRMVAPVMVPEGLWVTVTERGTQEWLSAGRAPAALSRLALARAALVDTGYFTEDQVGDDIAPRIRELHAALTSPPRPRRAAWLDRLLAHLDSLGRGVR